MEIGDLGEAEAGYVREIGGIAAGNTFIFPSNVTKSMIECVYKLTGEKEELYGESIRYSCVDCACGNFLRYGGGYCIRTRAVEQRKKYRYRGGGSKVISRIRTHEKGARYGAPFSSMSLSL